MSLLTPKTWSLYTDLDGTQYATTTKNPNVYTQRGPTMLTMGVSKNQGHLTWTQNDRIPHTRTPETGSPIDRNSHIDASC